MSSKFLIHRVVQEFHISKTVRDRAISSKFLTHRVVQECPMQRGKISSWQPSWILAENEKVWTRHRSPKPSRKTYSDQDQPQHDPDPPYYREVALCDIPSQYAEEVDKKCEPDTGLPKNCEPDTGLPNPPGRPILIRSPKPSRKTYSDQNFNFRHFWRPSWIFAENEKVWTRHRSPKPSRKTYSDQDQPQHDPDPPYYKEVALCDIPSQYAEEVDKKCEPDTGLPKKVWTRHRSPKPSWKTYSDQVSQTLQEDLVWSKFQFSPLLAAILDFCGKWKSVNQTQVSQTLQEDLSSWSRPTSTWSRPALLQGGSSVWYSLSIRRGDRYFQAYPETPWSQGILT